MLLFWRGGGRQILDATLIENEVADILLKKGEREVLHKLDIERLATM